MALTDKGAKDALKALTRADSLASYDECMASLERSRKELKDEFDETYKDVKLPDNLVTPEDYVNYVQSVVLGFGKKKTGEKGGQVLEAQPKKKCLNCGSTNIVRQRIEGKKVVEVVWTDEYKCQNCKERMTL